MRKLVIAIALSLLATGAFAQADRDVLVAPNGTIYTIESTSVTDADANIQASSVLTLTIQNGSRFSKVMVPDSTSAGRHYRATLAYDKESDTLFVLWLHMPNAMSSELLLAPYQGGKWQPAISVDERNYDLRYNLGIGITRRVAQLQPDGSYSDVPALIVHAVWWDETGAGEHARYALISIDKGAVTSIDVHDLSEFVSTSDDAAQVGSAFNPDILKHPAILDGPTSNSIDVLFGDVSTNLFHRVTLRPVAEARIHIPVGHSGLPDTPIFAAPSTFSADWSGSVTTLVSPHDRNKLLFCNATENGVTYTVHSQDGWSAVKTIPTNSTFSADSAIVALVKMISNE